MSMPKIPEEKFRPSLNEVLIDILKSIALEETALSHILNAEGEKNQLIIQKLEKCKDPKAIKELNNSMKQTEKIINTILMKEWLLLRKMETVSDIKETLRVCDKKHTSCDLSDNLSHNKNFSNDEHYHFNEDEDDHPNY